MPAHTPPVSTAAGCLGYYTPTNSSGTTYSTVTGGSWSVLAQYDSSSASYQLSSGSSVTIPAGKTVLVMLVSSTHYHTTYQFSDTNFFYDLHTTFSNSDIVCDMRMLTALQMARSGAIRTAPAVRLKSTPPVHTYLETDNELRNF